LQDLNEDIKILFFCSIIFGVTQKVLTTFVNLYKTILFGAVVLSWGGLPGVSCVDHMTKIMPVFDSEADSKQSKASAISLCKLYNPHCFSY